MGLSFKKFGNWLGKTAKTAAAAFAGGFLGGGEQAAPASPVVIQQPAASQGIFGIPPVLILGGVLAYFLLRKS